MSFRWMYATAAVVVVSSLVIGSLFWPSRPHYADKLLAEAYTERRTLEFRIPGARYAPLRITRGAQASSLDKPRVLLEAESIIGNALRKNPGSAEWLQAKARADLLEGNYEAALQTLKHALETRPDDLSLSTDLASVYAQRAVANDEPADNAIAVEILGKVLARTPNDPIALYNRAVASEHIFLFTQAIQDWERYLQVDARGEWAEDVRQRLSILRERMKNREDKSSQQLLTPSELVRLAASSFAELPLTVDPRLEDYIDVVIREWLPQAYPRETAAQQVPRDLKPAIDIIAAVAREKHGDLWLSEFVAVSSSASFPSAVSDLSRAVKASDGGDYDAARRFAARAVAEFGISQNAAGMLRAGEENLFALHLSHEGEGCLRAANMLRAKLEQRAYLWLRAQFRLEQGICELMMGDFGRAEESVQAAVYAAKSAKFPSLYLRAIGISSDLASTRGDQRLGWKLACSGLSDYWAGSSRAMVGYNFYTDLDSAAEVQKQAHVQVGIWQEALNIIESDPDPLLRAMAHSWMANAAFAAGIPEVAEREFISASRLFALAPQTEATRNDRVEAEISLARLQAIRGDDEGALSRLNRMRADVNQLSNHYVAIRFYAALGALEMRRNLHREAEKALNAAVALAERSLSSLKSERDALVWNHEASEAYRNLVELEYGRGDPQTALEIWEWYRGAGLRAGLPIAGNGRDLTPAGLSEGPPVPELRKVNQSLTELRTATVVSYGVFPEHLVIWVFDDRGVFTHNLAISSHDVADLAEQFVELCSDPQSDLSALRKDAEKLYEMLIAPVESRLSSSRTTFVEFDDSLSKIPIEALVDEKGRYFATRGPIVIEPGLYYKNLARRSEGISSKMSSLIVAVGSSPRSGARGLMPLSNVSREASTIASHFESPNRLDDERATLEAVGNLLPTAQVFHFAGHALVSPEVGLVLRGSGSSENLGLLGADVLKGEHLEKMRLAVLSACATDVGGADSIAGSGGLGIVFLRLGVPRVVGSRWEVDSLSTEFLMGKFYESLTSGVDVETALDRAESALRSTTEWNHPYFWASFETLGTP